MADANKSTPATFSQEAQIKPANPFRAIFPLLAIVLCAVLAHVIFYGAFGNPKNFQGGPEAYTAYQECAKSGFSSAECEEMKEKHSAITPIWTKGHPIGFQGLVFKGGFVIPIGLTLLMVLFTFVIERFITVARAGGRGNSDVFVKKVRMMLAKGQVEDAAKLCDNHKGSVASVIKAGLRKYSEMVQAHELEKEQRKAAIQQELEEATMLELPMLERNLPILATIASLGTLVGLIGTVLGMIRAFQALGEGGAPNAAELSVGISEALINTAIGITTSALAILFYNLFTTRIDGMTYAMDEAGYSIVQTFDVRN
ncbi:MAG: MotA/TolQ/ExbB proton channel family protein [Bacteroidia bacterium]|nr:MotA/TolQ/ExbB proton channel family protein [Bacteroidia bacterium]